MKEKIFAVLFCITCTYSNTNAQEGAELHRPQIHFSPKAHWINDPNGMVYYKGAYHLFYQYYPDSSVWGPMHWGHASSKDLVHWMEQPIALFPDSLGCIFSGSAVFDEHNTSGLGKNGQAPLVAIFTHHSFEIEKSGKNNFQNQSIAYSNDEGKTWIKYAGNPVLPNPGITDFRDPKVMWYEPQKKWIMTLATKDRITFYSSPNLKNWTRESEFGQDLGAHGGVWECPDLFTLDHNGKNIWVLIVNIGSGGPNKGSATQYFLGDFDGNKFTASDTATKWIDYGPDDYAGITWSNTGNRKIFLGWMTNWLYANKVPTEKWRGAMTLPRELQLKTAGEDILIASEPVKELTAIETKPYVLEKISFTKELNISEKSRETRFPCRLSLNLDTINDFSIILSNEPGDELVIGYDKSMNQYYIDRSKSGKVNFQNDFAARHFAPRFVTTPKANLSLLIDLSSIELFADDGLTVMTETFFPNKPYNKIIIKANGDFTIKKLVLVNYKSTWQ